MQQYIYIYIPLTVLSPMYMYIHVHTMYMYEKLKSDNYLIYSLTCSLLHNEMTHCTITMMSL